MLAGRGSETRSIGRAFQAHLDVVQDDQGSEGVGERAVW